MAFKERVQETLYNEGQTRHGTWHAYIPCSTVRKNTKGRSLSMQHITTVFCRKLVINCCYGK